MADTFKNLARALLGTSETTIGAAVPASRSWIGKRVWVCNGHTAAVSVTLHHRLAGEAVSQTNAILQSASIPSFTTQVLDELDLATTDLLSGYASVANVVSVNVYGDEVA